MDVSARRHRWARWTGAGALVLSLAAFSWPTWLEGWIGEGADHGDGSIEYALATGFALAALVLIGYSLRSARQARSELGQVPDGR